MTTEQTPLGVIGAGVVLVIIGLAVKALIPRLLEVGSFVVSVGWIAIAIGVVWLIIAFVMGLFRGGPRV